METLSAIVDFLYLGEVNVFHETLDSFLTIAEELKLTGLRQTAVPNGEVECDTDEPTQGHTRKRDLPKILPQVTMNKRACLRTPL